MNAIEKIKASLGIKSDDYELVTVVSGNNGMVEAIGHNSKALKLAGNFVVGTQLIVKNGNVQSVIVESNVVVYDD